MQRSVVGRCAIQDQWCCVLLGLLMTSRLCAGPFRVCLLKSRIDLQKVYEPCASFPGSHFKLGHPRSCDKHTQACQLPTPVESSCMCSLHTPRDPSIEIIPIMENQMEKKMENEMESGVIRGLFRDPSVEIIQTLGPKVCKSCLH